MIKLLVVGGGNMGGALALSCFANQKDTEMVLLEPNKDRCNELISHGIDARIDLKEYNLELVDVVLLAVKPQISISVIEDLAKKVRKNTLWVSIMAGKSIESMRKINNVDKVVRLMPNLPTTIAKGTIGIFANHEVLEKEKSWLTNCLSTANEIIWVEEENKIDAITAISGSGPAYVFYFMDAIYQKAISLGFSSEQSIKLVNNTFLGALSLVEQSDLDYKDWISKVKSKKGTTEAALDFLAKNNVDELIQSALEKAYKRAKELSS